MNENKTITKPKSFFFEVYLNHPVTEEGGWDIKVGFVLAPDAERARQRVKTRFGRRFDTFIQCYECPLHPLGCETVFIR